MNLEQIINDAIINGNKYETRGLGTILPDPQTMAIVDKHAARIKREKLAAASVELAGLERRVVGGEVRYYKTPTIYTPAIVRGSVRRWFEVREDGDYAIK